jgi:hypothetical protein
MTSKEQLIIDFYAELNHDGYGDEQWEENSYQYMVDTVENTVIDASFTLEDRCKVLNIMSDISVSLREAYFNVLHYLEECKEALTNDGPKNA